MCACDLDVYSKICMRANYVRVCELRLTCMRLSAESIFVVTCICDRSPSTVRLAVMRLQVRVEMLLFGVQATVSASMTSKTMSDFTSAPTTVHSTTVAGLRAVKLRALLVA